MKTINVQSGHTLFVQSVPAAMVPDECTAKSNYKEFYVVKNWNSTGVLFFYLGKGHPDAPREIVVWYRNCKMWTGFGKNLKAAIEGAQRDGWMYAK